MTLNNFQLTWSQLYLFYGASCHISVMYKQVSESKPVNLEVSAKVLLEIHRKRTVLITEEFWRCDLYLSKTLYICLVGVISKVTYVDLVKVYFRPDRTGDCLYSSAGACDVNVYIFHDLRVCGSNIYSFYLEIVLVLIKLKASRLTYTNSWHWMWGVQKQVASRLVQSLCLYSLNSITDKN